MPPETQTHLLDALRATLPALPGFRSLSLFGSLAEGRADEYSDIDLMVTTDDLPEAKAHLLGLLEEVGPVEFCWAIDLRPDEWNPTIVFRDEGYHRKLDLGLADTSAQDRTIPAEQTVLLCDEPRTPPRSVRTSDAYVPENGTVGHFLLDKSIGCLRYVKARKRGQVMTCYRFAAAAVQWRLALLYARLTEKLDFRSKLSTEQCVELDRLLPAAEGTAVIADLDFSNLRAMDHVVRIAMEKMLDDGARLAAMVGESLPADVFGRISGFLAGELPCPHG